jgi:RimJ/RimL family protein N-acetyltransferase
MLRPATGQDSSRLLEWRNDPDAVRFSITRRAVTAAEHKRWLAASLEDTDVHLWIAEQAGVPVGQIRVDMDRGTGLVSIAVAPEHRGRGLAAVILNAMVAEVGRSGAVRKLRAHVDPDNPASLRAFNKAGFRSLLKHEEGFVVLERRVIR